MDWNRFTTWCGVHLVSLMPALASAAKLKASAASKLALPDYTALLIDPHVAFYFVMVAFTTVTDTVLVSRTRYIPISFWRKADGVQRGKEPSPIVFAILAVLCIIGAYGILLFGMTAFAPMPNHLTETAKTLSLLGVTGIVPLSIITQLAVSRAE